MPFARDVTRAKDTPRVKDDEEIAREIDALLDRRKLRLVLDLDHTLLNSATIEDCAADGADALLESRVAAEIQAENARASKNGPRAESPGAETCRSLHRVADSGLWTKTRPGVRTFLRKAACLFEIHICTAGSQAYAERMRALLDPTRELVRGSVVGLATFDEFGVPEPHEVVKTMARELRGSEPIAVVLDDTAAVWPGHAENLIVCERYVYFPSCARKFGNVTPSLLERRVDESADWGMLATVFDVLRRVHADFFARRAAARELRLRTEARDARRFAADDDDEDEDDEDGEDVANREVVPSRSQSKTKRSDVSVSVPVTVPELLTLEKRRVLRGVELVFSGVVPSGVDPSAHPLWRLAEAFGARCARAGRRRDDARGGGAREPGPRGDGQDDLGDAAGEARRDAGVGADVRRVVPARRRNRLHSAAVTVVRRARSFAVVRDEASREASSVFLETDAFLVSPPRFYARRGDEEIFRARSRRSNASPDTSGNQHDSIPSAQSAFFSFCSVSGSGNFRFTPFAPAASPSTARVAVWASSSGGFFFCGSSSAPDVPPGPSGSSAGASVSGRLSTTAPASGDGSPAARADGFPSPPSPPPPTRSSSVTGDSEPRSERSKDATRVLAAARSSTSASLAPPSGRDGAPGEPAPAPSPAPAPFVADLDA